MEFIEPSILGFTVYSKSGCPNCLKIKSLLKEKNLLFVVVDCDEYILEEKEAFLLFIKNLTCAKNEDRFLFPIVFYDKQFIGGYKETCEYIDKLLLSFEDFTF
jgi:glutaredoxin